MIRWYNRVNLQNAVVDPLKYETVWIVELAQLMVKPSSPFPYIKHNSYIFRHK